MESNQDVLVVIQAESGEEIALPLAALDEQHQEVVVESGGVSGHVFNQHQQLQNNLRLSAPRIKQKRKNTLVCLPLNDEEINLELQIFENPPCESGDDVTKRKPKKEYRANKRKSSSVLRSTPSPIPLASTDQQQPSPIPQPTSQETSPVVNIKKETQEATQTGETPGRRTRLSNACRVATGKSYKCNDCDFSTERINNIILHVKETCPKLKMNNR